VKNHSKKLIFIIRDWPFPYDHNYGYSREYTEYVLKGNEKQTADMLTLRENIKSSFDDIEAFLMPFPGKSVAQEKNFKGNVMEIDPDFLNCVKDLVPSIFYPEKLIVKRINGEKVRAREFVIYLEEYVKAFDSDEMPAPKSILAANADGQIRILYEKCSTVYVNMMENAFHNPKIYFTKQELDRKHEHANSSSLSKFRIGKKLGNQSLISEWEEKLINSNWLKFAEYQKINECREKLFSSIWKTFFGAVYAFFY